jgi:hypothetical protein
LRPSFGPLSLLRFGWEVVVEREIGIQFSLGEIWFEWLLGSIHLQDGLVLYGNLHVGLLYRVLGHFVRVFPSGNEI